MYRYRSNRNTANITTTTASQTPPPPDDDYRMGHTNDTADVSTSTSTYLNSEQFVDSNRYERDAPDMDEEEQRMFEQHIVPEVQALAQNDDEPYNSHINTLTVTAAAAAIDSGDTDENTDVEESNSDSSDVSELDNDELCELKDVRAEMAGAPDPILTRDPPDLCDDLCTGAEFAAFDDRWVPLLLVDPQVQAVFIYFRTIALGGLGAVLDDVESTMYGAEMHGVTVKILSRDVNCIRSRVYFSPRSYDDRSKDVDSEVKKAELAEERLCQLGTIDGSHFDSKKGVDGERILRGADFEDEDESAVAKLQKSTAVLENRAERFARQYHNIRQEAMDSRPPMHFYWDKKTHLTPAVLTRLATERYENIAKKLMYNNRREMRDERNESNAAAAVGYGDAQVSSDSSTSSSSSDDDDNEDDEEDGEDDDEDVSAFMNMPMPERGFPSIAMKKISSSVSNTLAKTARRRMKNLLSAEPDAAPRASNELSGWIEDHMCVDVVIYPGERVVNAHDNCDEVRKNDEVPRQLAFCFGLAEQNPYSFSEIVRKGSTPGGPFSKQITHNNDSDDG